MLQLTINEKGGPSRVESFEKAEVTIGRVQGNDIILPKGNISKRHSRIVFKDGKFIIVDLKSTNGTYVNGKKITAPQVIKATDKVYIGDFILQIDLQNGAAEEAAPRGASIPGAEEEIDLFGRDAAFEPEAPAPASPGLIDDNFDQEFEANPEPQGARLPAPSARPATRQPEAEPELELDEDFGPEDAAAAPPEMELDDADFEPNDPIVPDPPAPLDPESADMLETPAPEVEAPPEALAPPTSMPEPAAEAAPTSMPAPAPTSMPTSAPIPAPPPPAPVAAAPAYAVEPLPREVILAALHAELLEVLDLPGRALNELPSLRDAAETSALGLVARFRGQIGPGESEEALAAEAAGRAVGLEAIAPALENEAIYEIAITPEREVMVDREGRLEPAGRRIETEAEVVRIIRGLAALGGLVSEELPPLVDVRLRDGSRVLGTLPPLAFRGPSLTIRKTTRDFFTLDKLREYDTIDARIQALLDATVRYRRNVLLSMGPGVTATATLNALLSQMPADDRIVTVERGIELHLRGHTHAVAFDLADGLGMPDVLHFAAQAQADRVLLGDLHEGEIGDVIDALSNTTEGAAAALSALSPASAIEVLEGWLGEGSGPAIARAFPLVLQEQKLSDNSRRITQVAEVAWGEGELVVTPIFEFEPSGLDESMMITGTFKSTGHVPSFIQGLVDRGEAEIDLSVYEA